MNENLLPMAKNINKSKGKDEGRKFLLPHLGQWIKRSGRKQTEIARAVGVGDSHLSLVVAERRGVSVQTAQAIAEELGISLDQLLHAPSAKSAEDDVLSLEEFSEDDRRTLRDMADFLRAKRA